MWRHLLFALLGLAFSLPGIAQIPQSPSFHGGDPSKSIDLKNPENSSYFRPLRYDYAKQNPRFRAMIPRKRKCVSVEMDKDLKTKNVSETEGEFENWINESMKRVSSTRSLRRMAPTVYTLPVVVHVIYSRPSENISDGQIQSQFTVLNQDYRRENPDRLNTPKEFKSIAVDTGIEFCLASLDPDGNPTDGINRISMSGSPFTDQYINEVIKPNTIWDPTRYLNIWVCNIASGILGYAQFPVSSTLTGISEVAGNATNANTDGVVINYSTFGTTGTVSPPFDRGRTATHEIGHWLGLRHIWGDRNCGDDYCDDTPQVSSANYACPPGVAGCVSGTNAMIQNYMDYTDDACMNLFTRSQRERMRIVLEQSPRRKELLTSSVCSAGQLPPEPDFISDVQTGCGPLTVKFSNQSTGDPTEFAWTFGGGKPGSSNQENPSVVFKSPGIYSVSLRASNPSGSRSVMKEGFIRVVAQGNAIPYAANFEDGFPPQGFQIKNAQNDQTWAYSEKVSAEGKGSGAAYFNNYDNNAINSQDWLLSPVLNIAHAKGTRLSFKVAYAAYDNTYSDTLGVFVATSCGTIFRNIYFKGGADLATTGETKAFQSPFVPGAREWRTETIDLSQFDGQSSIQVAFVNFSGYGNDLFLDDFSLSDMRTPEPIAAFSASKTSICAGESISFTDESINQPTNWIWSFPHASPGSDTTMNPTVTYNEPGIYDVILTVSNASGSHSVTQEGMIVVKSRPSLSLTSEKTNICAGEIITLTAAGSDTYIWTEGEKTLEEQGPMVTVQPLEDKIYTVTAKGNQECEAAASQAIRVEQGRVLTLTPAKAKVCAGNEVTLNATGAESYEWSPAQGLSNTKSGLVKASPSVTTTYKVIGRTRTGCELVKEITVVVEDAPTNFAISAPSEVICPGETLTMTASGAASYTWYPVESLNISEGNTVVANPKTTTTYTVTASTENGCTAQRSLTIRAGRQPNVEIRTAKYNLCKGESIILTATGATRFNWTPEEGLDAGFGATVQATPLVTTAYSVIGMSNEGCSDTTQVELNVVEPAQVTITNSQPVICRGERALLEVNGGVSYRWSPSIGLSSAFRNQIFASPTRNTTYRVTATDRNGCTSTAETKVSIAENYRPKAKFTAEKTIICAGLPIQMTDLSGSAVEYYWEFPNGSPSTSTEQHPTVTYMEEGLYDVVLTVKNCYGQEDRYEEIGFIVVTAPFTLGLNTMGDITICKDEPYRLAAYGAENYEWSPSVGLDATVGNVVHANPAVSTTYTVTGSDGDGCKSSESVTLNVSGNGNQLSISPVAPSICKGESIVLEATGGITYNWSPQRGLDNYSSSQVLASPSKTTTYQVETTDLDGCTFTDTLTVHVRQTEKLVATADQSTICPGDITSLKINQKGVFNWEPAYGLSNTVGTEIDAFPKETTSYTITGKDQQGCTLSAQVTISVNRASKLKLNAQDPQICKGGATLLTASNGRNYKWSPTTGLDKTSGPIVRAAPKTTTTYTVISEGEGCANTQSVTVEVVPPNPIQLLPASARICQGDVVSVKAEGANTYVWDAEIGLSNTVGESVVIAPSQTTSYRVHGRDSLGCETEGAITVVVEEGDFLSVSSSLGTICEEDEVELLAEGAISYEWQKQEGIRALETARTYAQPTETSEYRVIGKNSYGCTDTASVKVAVSSLKPEFKISTTRIDLAKDHGFVQFNDETPGATAWLWDFGTGSLSETQNPTHVYTEPGVYNVKLHVTNGICNKIVSQTILVENSSSLEDISDEGMISISDRPSNGIVNLQVESPRKMYLRLRLLDDSGTQLLAGALRIKSGSYQQQLDLSGYDKGIYHIQVTDGKETLTQKIQYL